MDEKDRLFYMMWGLVIALIGVAAAIALMGYGAEAWLILFGGAGVALIIVSGKDNTKFYGGIGLLLFGVLMYAILSGANVAWVLIAIVIVIGALVIWHGLRGGKNE